MNEGFQEMTISDPNKLKTFLEGTTGSIIAILNVRIAGLHTTLFISHIRV